MSEIISEGGKRKASADGPAAARPVVSVITSVYNGAEGIERTIRSILAQNYPGVEYIVVDGGSGDGTVEILKRYNDSIDYWVSARDKGIYDAWNKGVQLAKGEWIAFLGSGDVYLPGLLPGIWIFGKRIRLAVICRQGLIWCVPACVYVQ